MTGSVTELNLATGTDSDDSEDYLTGPLVTALTTIGNKFAAAGGHGHTGASGDAGPLGASGLAASAVTTAKIAANSVTKVLTDQHLVADAWTNSALSAGDNQVPSFSGFSITVDEATDYFVVVVDANLALSSPNASITAGWQVYLDGALARPVSRAFAPTGATTDISGGVVYLPAMAAGAHTIEPRVFASGAITSGTYLQASTAPTLHFLYFTVIEVRK